MKGKKTIGFIGAGAMAGAIIRGLGQAGAASKWRFMAFDTDPERLKDLVREGAVEAARSNVDLVRRSDVIILAVKPAQVNAVIKEVARAVGGGKLLVSIAAGVTLFQIESRLTEKAPLIRVMPNTPLLVGKGMSAISCGTGVRAEDRRLVLELFGAVGRVIEVEEKFMDAVTALSGSGPAYVFGFIEGLADGGVAAGLPRREALLLAAQTVAGAAEMVLATGRHPAELKDMVASPGGTTIKGYQVLEEGGFKGLLMEAVAAGHHRARELAEG
jgi:pyrroline-5-carboxylate reductase